MDMIEEPPEDRYPIQTYVMEETREIIRETVRRELDRGGQVYVVVNRISAIERVAADIARLVPEARVAAGHGRMNEVQLENVMMDFVDGDSDVLVSTTIIESGIDIPNVNTILIMDADHFGLSQLYQLRGRVGRTNRLAFAYLLYRRDKALSEVAEKRLRTIREFTEFGAGFKIAMRDLEIRGAGNLLGSEQHGHMAAIGYELYCRMVEEAVQALSGSRSTKTRTEAADGDEVKIDVPVTAFIPEYYIEDEASRLEAYRRIALIGGAEDAAEVTDELIDRYGSVPSQVKALITIALARARAREAGVVRVHTRRDELMFTFADGSVAPKGALRGDAAVKLAPVIELLGAVVI
jgi:transcription-repair coupling factor (superfamily II helicase)